MTLKKSICSDKILLVHNGALGDFFMVWPSILALCRALPEAELFWAGKPAMYRWLKRLGLTLGGPDLHRGLRKLYGSDQWPRELAGVQVIWFGLHGPCPCPHQQILFLEGVDRGSMDTSPRELYKNKLQAHGISGMHDWQHRFQTMFRQPVTDPGRNILLFPGSGHPAKNWDRVKFLELAEKLANAGEFPCFVLGPVEQEQGVRYDSFPCHHPHDLGELESLLLSARMVIGNDSGPMHLAGCLGIPGIALFGPTSPQQWGPPGIAALHLDMDCRPCSSTARITCIKPVCMEIPVEIVFKKCVHLLRATKPVG